MEPKHHESATRIHHAGETPTHIRRGEAATFYRCSWTLGGLLLSVLASACSDAAPPRPAFEELENLDVSGAASCGRDYTAAVTGQMIDDTGAPIEGGRPQMCIHREDGASVCLQPPETRPDGFWVQVIAEANRCIDRVALRASLPGGGFATTYCPLSLTLEDSVYHHPVPIVLHRLEQEGLPAEGDSEAPRDVALSGGVVLTDVIPAELFGDYDKVGARHVAEPCFGQDARLEGVWALGPEAYPSDAGYGVRLPNVTGLAEGTRIELLVLGGLATRLLDGTQVPEAELAVFGQGEVIGDVIVGDDDARLPELTWVAYRTL